MKKLVFPFITLLIGAAIGYFVGNKTSSDRIEMMSHQLDVARVSRSYTFLSPPDGRIKIDDAKRYIQTCHDLNKKDIQSGGGLYAMDPNKGKVPLDGFVIQRKSLEDIFKKNKNYTGIRVYIAKHPSYPGDGDRIFTFIFTATFSKSPSKDKTLTDGDSTDPIYDHVYPCPTACGDLAPQN